MRKYQGIKEARNIFAIPWRVLRVHVEDVIDSISGNTDGISFEHKGDQDLVDPAKLKVETMNRGQDAAMKSVTGSDDVKKKKKFLVKAFQPIVFNAIIVLYCQFINNTFMCILCCFS